MPLGGEGIYGNIPTQIDISRIIDVTDTEAFLVRKDSDGGDIFTVDTTNSDVELGSGVDLVIAATAKIYLDGKGNTYITESSNNNIRFVNNTNITFNINQNTLIGHSAGGGGLLAGGGTSTAPSVYVDGADLDTGWGPAAADAMSGIAGGVEAVRLVEASSIAALHYKEITTPTAIDSFGSYYTKSDNEPYFQDGAGVEHLISTGANHYASYNIHANSTATDIGEAGTYIGARGFSSVVVSNFTFDAGSTGPIASFADGSGGQVVIADVAHGLEDGEIISISGTTNYNGVFTVQNKADDTFEITHSWDGDDGAANWYQASNLVVGSGGDGEHIIIYTVNAESAGANKEFDWHIFINATRNDASHADHFFTGATSEQNISGHTAVSISEGDVIGLYVSDITDGTNIIHKSATVTIHKL